MRVPDKVRESAVSLALGLNTAIEAEREGLAALATYPPGIPERHNAEANVAFLTAFREEGEAACKAAQATLEEIEACTTQSEADAALRRFTAIMEDHQARVAALAAFGSFMDPEEEEEG